jgi:hypothetical protein
MTPGTRVQVVSAPIGVALASPFGVIVGPAEWDGYCFVRLDVPALDRDRVPLTAIRVAVDNLAAAD